MPIFGVLVREGRISKKQGKGVLIDKVNWMMEIRDVRRDGEDEPPTTPPTMAPVLEDEWVVVLVFA